MADIFDGIDLMTDDELRMQIALFKNVNFTNAVKETGHRVIGGIKDFANALTEAFGSRNQFEYNIRYVSDIVMDAMLKLRVKPRNDLMELLNEAILKVCSDLSGEQLNKDVHKERLNKIIVSEASKAFSIEKYKTMANKTDEIIIEYNNAFLQALHNKLIKETGEQKNNTDKLIQDRLNAISMDDKRMLQQQIMPKEFNGSGIGKVLRQERNYKYLKDAIIYLGKEAFDCTAAEVLTIFTAVKGLKRTTRMQLARMVWFAGKKYGHKYSYSADVFPGYIPADKIRDISDEEKEFRLLMQQRGSLSIELKSVADDLEKQIKQRDKDKEHMDESMECYNDFKLKFKELESRKDDYIKGKRSEDESKSYYAEVNDTKRNLDRSEQDFDKLNKKLQNQDDKIAETQNKADLLEKELETLNIRSGKQIEDRVQLLKLSWGAYFYKFQFEPDVFHSVVVLFGQEERINLEMMLKELHESHNPDNLKDESGEEFCRIYCYLSAGRNAVIEFSEKRIINITRK